jgi:hypothetical protein
MYTPHHPQKNNPLMRRHESSSNAHFYLWGRSSTAFSHIAGTEVACHVHTEGMPELSVLRTRHVGGLALTYHRQTP